MYSVLYVDDDEGLLGIIKFQLEKNNEFTVETVTSALVALEKIRNTPYDVVLSDFNMPGMDGIALLQHVRSHHGNLPFILFTVKGRGDVVIAAVENGADYYIQKGVDSKAMIVELTYKLKRAIERRHMMDELERSNRQMTNIINFLPDATFVRDIQGRVIAWNKAMETMTGVSRDAILGKGDMEYSVPFFGEKRPLLADLVLGEKLDVASSYQYFEKRGDKITSEVYVPHFNDGDGANLWITASPLYDSDRRTVTGAIESFRDISALFALRRDLNITREMVQGFADIIPVAIYEMDLEYTLTFANMHAFNWLGITEEDLSANLSVLQFVSPHYRDRVITDIRKVLEGSGGGREYLLVRRDGNPFPALVYGSRITNIETGEPAGIRGVVIDLTERKKEAQELYESREQLELALMAGGVSIWDVDMRTLKVRDPHQWLSRTLGYTPEDFPALTINSLKGLIHPLDIPGVLVAFSRHLSGQNPLLELELRLACSDKSWKWVAVRCKVVERGENNEPVRITGTINEISPHKKQDSPEHNKESGTRDRIAQVPSTEPEIHNNPHHSRVSAP